MACVVHLGRVTVFGATDCETVLPSFTCIQNIQMIYNTEGSGGSDLFSIDLPDNVPPGNYELTCACSDQGWPDYKSCYVSSGFDG